MRRLTVLATLCAALVLFTALGCTAKKTNTNAAKKNTTTANPSVVNGSSSANTAVTNLNVAVQSTEEQDLQRIASSFTERYGSFSNQSDYTNFESLYAFMTTAFAQQTKNTVQQDRAKAHDNTVYYGMTTKRTSVQTLAYDTNAGTARLSVQTLRHESVGSTTSRTYPESMTITMQKEHDVWKVSAAEWDQQGK